MQVGLGVVYRTGIRQEIIHLQTAKRVVMSCISCASSNQSRFATEIAIHLPGLTTPHVFVFPMVVVCLDCGFTEFSIPESDLRLLAKADSTSA